jgi:hypothetical protein
MVLRSCCKKSVEENNGEGLEGAGIAFNFGINGFDEAAIVGQPGERVAADQIADVILGAFVFGGFCGEDHGGSSGDGHKRLQK